MTSRYANEAMIELRKHRGVDITIEGINFLLNDNYCYALKLTDQLQTIYSFADVYNSNYRVFPKVTSPDIPCEILPSHPVIGAYEN